MEPKVWDIGLIMDDSTCRDTNLSLIEKVIYSYVQGFTKNNRPCFATSKTIAAKFNIGESYVRTARSKLVAMGYLERKVVDGRTLFRARILKEDKLHYDKTLAAAPAEPEEEPAYENLTQVFDDRTQVFDKRTMVPIEEKPVFDNRTPSVRLPDTECSITGQGVFDDRTHNNNININQSLDNLDRARATPPDEVPARAEVPETRHHAPNAPFLKNGFKEEGGGLNDTKDRKLDSGEAKRKLDLLLRRLGNRMEVPA